MPRIAHSCRLAVLGLVLGAGAFAADAPSPRPSVLFIAVDDMNDWTGYLGGYAGKVHTPNLDRLIRQGVAFANAHAPSPVCNPSRVAILSGRMPSSTGVYNNDQWWKPNLPNLVTTPAYYRQQGYRVVGSGKIFHHTAGSNPPEQWDEFKPLLFKESPWYRANKLNYPWTDYEDAPAGFPFSGLPGLRHEFDWGSLPRAEGDYDDVRTVDYAVKFLQGGSPGPFFLACGIFRPHLPWYVPGRFFDLYPLKEIVLPVSKPGDLDDVPPAGRELAAQSSGDFPRLRESGAWPRAVQAYLASISFADEQLGRLLDALAASPHARNTIVVFWSDHGFHLGEKEHWNKSTLWERSTRVPFVIAAPQVAAAGRISFQPVSLVDIFPTLIRLCGLPVLSGLDGEDLSPLLKDPGAVRAKPAVIEYQQGNAAVRSERYRYIRYRDGTEEFYDHAIDPSEWHNLAGDPSRQAIKQDMARWLPARWAEPVRPKRAFDFDPSTHTWKERQAAPDSGRTNEAGGPLPPPEPLAGGRDAVRSGRWRRFWVRCAVSRVRPVPPFFVPSRWLERYPLDRLQLPEIQAGDLEDVPPPADLKRGQ